jgi:hypothetical protein
MQSSHIIYHLMSGIDYVLVFLFFLVLSLVFVLATIAMFAKSSLYFLIVHVIFFYI